MRIEIKKMEPQNSIEFSELMKSDDEH